MTAGALLRAMESPPPSIDAPAAAAAVARHYGLQGACRRLAGERDLNFRFTASDGRQYVLKVWNRQQAAEVIDLQVSVLQHLSRADPEIPVPHVFPTRHGKSLAVVEAGDGHRHCACLLAWLEGTFLRDLGGSDAIRRRLGYWLGRLDRALAGFTHPGMHRDMIWDLSRSDRLRALLPAVPDARARALAEQALDLFEEDVLPALPTVRRQVLHGDFHLDNVLATADGREVCGIIDFGDTLHAPLICDLAIACAYQVEAGDPLAGLVPVVEAYHAACPLVAHELTLLPGLVRARLTASIVITAHMASLHPENREYLLIDNAAAARRLARLSQQDPARDAQRLQEACGLG